MGLMETSPLSPPRLSEPDFQHLAGLLGVGETADFLHRSFGQDRHFSKIDVDDARALFGWQTLNAAIAEHRLVPPRLRLERGGDMTKGVFTTRRTRRGAVLHDLDLAVLTERLGDGATLIVDSVNELSPPLRALCEGLAGEFSASCQANLYACWGTSQGFDVHWDDHDVFVIQVEGSKTWQLYGPTLEAPTRRGPGLEAPRPTAPIEEHVLLPGDVLYLPRGYWHAAAGRGEPTLHLTIGLTRKTGGDFLHWLSDHVLSVAIARRDLPLEADDTVLGDHIATLLASMAEHDPAALARLYRRHVEANQVHRPRPSFPFIGGARIDPDLRVTLTSGVTRLSPLDGEEVLFSWRGVRFTLAGGLEAPLRALIDGEAMSVAHFTSLTDASARHGAQAFIADMAKRGVLVLEAHGG